MATRTRRRGYAALPGTEPGADSSGDEAIVVDVAAAAGVTDPDPDTAQPSSTPAAVITDIDGGAAGGAASGWTWAGVRDAVADWLTPKRVAALVVVGVLLVALVVLLATGLLRKGLVAVLRAVHRLGYGGEAVLALVDIVAVPLLVPSTLLNVGAGFLFGLGMGYLVAAVGCVTGSVVSFLLGKRAAFAYGFHEKLLQNRYFRAIDRALAQKTTASPRCCWAWDWEAFYLVLLARLPPLFPFPLVNYAFALTNVPLHVYAIGTWLGLAPGTLIDVYLGSLLEDFTSVSKHKHPTWYLAVSIGVTILLTAIITFQVKRLLNKYVSEDEEAALRERAPARDSDSDSDSGSEGEQDRERELADKARSGGDAGLVVAAEPAAWAEPALPQMALVQGPNAFSQPAAAPPGESLPAQSEAVPMDTILVHSGDTAS